MTDRIDEMSNEELARRGHSEHVLTAELDRVERVIGRHSLIGSDLNYWFERSRILRSLLHSGTRVG